ncbi:hypothetical protein [Elizabethkingia anophelis]|uniref:hypothetical protein n=1 Tax=Elizabethkingia anophelis TaxID=1117645 RepID=UPI0021A8E4DC|nr:hypothetical protein [Elizabethkingia anophelis]
MKKRLFYPALWGILALSTLTSCRTEDVANTQKQEKDTRFAVFIPQSGKTVNYANGFSFLMQRYDNLYKTNLSGVVNNNPVIGNLSASTNKSASVTQPYASYVEFRIHSQTVTGKDGDKWVVFPKVEGNRVTGLILAFLSNKETKVSYKTIDSQTEWYNENIGKFQDAFTNFQKRSKFLNLSASINPMAGGDCGDDVQKCGEIPEVVITVPKAPGTPVPPVTIIVPIINPGTCNDFQNCAPGGGGGGNPVPPFDDSCAKLKAQQNTEDYKKRIEALENKLKETHENGYIQDKDGNYTELTQRGESENSKSMRLPNDISNLRGFLHTHVKKTSVVIDGEVYEAEGVDMFSPADIERFLEIAKFSADQGRSLDDIFAVMVSSSGNYTLKFTGDKNQIITKFQDNSLDIGVYLRYMQQTSGEFKNMSMEQKFLKYLDEYMNARGVSLYKDNKDGTNTRMDLNDYNKNEMKKSDC